MAHTFVHKPLELWSFRLWPMMIVLLWASVITTGGVLGYDGWFFYVSAWMALVGSFLHFLFPYEIGIRYFALITNLVAMSSRSVDYALSGFRWKVALAGFAVWITIASAKVVIFFLSAALVETKLAKAEINGG
jgi:hypothetical protein